MTWTDPYDLCINEYNEVENIMNIEYKGKITLLLFIIILASIIPFCMISSFRESIVQNRVNELSIARQEHILELDQLFAPKNNHDISMRKGEQRE